MGPTTRKLDRRINDGSTLPQKPTFVVIASILKCHERTNSNLPAVGANARGRNAAFPSLRPVLADQCKSQQGCLPTMRVQRHGCSSAQTLRALSHRYGLCG